MIAIAAAVVWVAWFAKDREHEIYDRTERFGDGAPAFWGVFASPERAFDALANATAKAGLRLRERYLPGADAFGVWDTRAPWPDVDGCPEFVAERSDGAFWIVSPERVQ